MPSIDEYHMQNPPIPPEPSTTPDAIVAFVAAYQASHTYAPTMQEIAIGTGRALSVVYYHIKRLARARRVTYTPHTARSIHTISPT